MNPDQAQTSVRRRLPTAMSVVLYVFGASWFVLALINARINLTGINPFDAMSLAANLSGASLLLLSGFLGSMPRPPRPVPWYGLALVIIVCAIPVLEAIATAKIGQNYDLAGSASSDILVVTVAAIATVAVYRSRPVRSA